MLDIDLTRERLLADKRQLQAIITNPNASVEDKLHAIDSDIALNITLVVVLSYIGDNITYQHGLHFCQEVYPYRNQNKV